MKPYSISSFKAAFGGLLAIVFLLGAVACVETRQLTEKPVSADPIASCVGCHTSYSTLQALADPDTDPPSEGCGGAAPYIEPFDRVFLGGPGYQHFKNSEHGRLECTYCHGGVDGTADKHLAHSGDFVKHPSLNAALACGDCHVDIVHNAAGSLHEQGWGQKNSIAKRMGVSSFDELPDELHTAYDRNCATCHASCGDCHVNRPKAGGGGLYRGHQFSRTPDIRDNCVACHSSRGGHAYFGLGVGARPDVHLTKAGLTCLDCHSSQQIHGDGQIYAHRFESKTAPQCGDCHADLEASNQFHEAHYQDLDCYVCHAQDYNNCGSCHVGGAGARIVSHLSYKIGLNPIPENRPYQFVLLRRTPAAPDTFSVFGVDTMPNFDAKTTYNYTTPHNILLWTARTETAPDQNCYVNCHVLPNEPVNHNRELYLFAADLKEEWEKSANQHIVVDDALPAGWR